MCLGNKGLVHMLSFHLAFSFQACSRFLTFSTSQTFVFPPCNAEIKSELASWSLFPFKKHNGFLSLLEKLLESERRNIMFLLEALLFVMFIPMDSVTSQRVCKPWAQNGPVTWAQDHLLQTHTQTARQTTRRDERVVGVKETKPISEGGGKEKIR